MHKDPFRIKYRLPRVPSLSLNYSLEKSSSTSITKALHYTSHIALVSLCALLLGCEPPTAQLDGSSSDSSLSSGTTALPGSTIIQCSSGPADLAGMCRNTAALTPGALEAIGSQVASADTSLTAFVAVQQGSDGSIVNTLDVNWSPYPESVSGYYVYYGSTPETATTLASDLAIGTANFDASAPSISYQPLQDLGLNAGDTVCFRIQAYDAARALYDWADVQCTVV